jgi:hypothetical protein
MRYIPALLAAATIVWGCGQVNPKSQDSLREAVLLFNEGVRWGRLQDVMPRVAPDSAEHFLEMHEDFGKDLQVSDYEIINTTVDGGKKVATVTVQITWYRKSGMEVFATVLTQKWEEVGRDWLMMAESFVSGQPF